jgi:hypothetical protein
MAAVDFVRHEATEIQFLQSQLANYNSHWLSDLAPRYKINIDRHFINFTSSCKRYISTTLSVVLLYVYRSSLA